MTLVLHLITVGITLGGLGIAYTGIGEHNKRLSFIGAAVALAGALVRTCLELSITGIGIAVGIYGLGMLLLLYLYKH